MSHVRVITQQDERKNRGGDWLQAVETARTQIHQITDTFRHLELLEEQLGTHGLRLQADLGPVGGAARAAYKDMSRDTGPHFEMPRSA